MRLRFKKKAKVLVEGSKKYFLKGAIYSMGDNLGEKYIESGDAEVYPPKEVARKTRKTKMKFTKTDKVEEDGKV